MTPTNARLIAGWILVLASGCTPGRQDQQPGGDRAQSARASIAAERTRPDTSALRRFLSGRGYALTEILAQRGPYGALLGTGPGNVPVLLIVRLYDSLEFVADALPLEPTDPRPTALWLTVNGTDAVAFTFDAPVEGPVATLVLVRQATSFRLTYQDTAAVCRPAQVMDLDGDGRAELIAHAEDPTKGSCMTECHLKLEEKFGIQPAWVEVLSWNGTAWEPGAGRFPDYYRRLAEKYQRVAGWLADSADAETCRRVYWSPTPQFFLDLAARANATAR